MRKRKEITLDMINEWFTINDNGEIFWKKHSRPGMIGWTASTLTDSGYLMVTIPKKGSYFVHRLVYCYFNEGAQPEIIDHIDRDKSNNNPSNLRSACASLNASNCERRDSKSASGYRNVYKYKSGFRAEFNKNGKRFRGVFRKTAQQAYDDYLELFNEIYVLC